MNALLSVVAFWRKKWVRRERREGRKERRAGRKRKNCNNRTLINSHPYVLVLYVGLGKTVEVLACILAHQLSPERQQQVQGENPSLVVAKTTLIISPTTIVQQVLHFRSPSFIFPLLSPSFLVLPLPCSLFIIWLL